MMPDKGQDDRSNMRFLLTETDSYEITWIEDRPKPGGGGHEFKVTLRNLGTDETLVRQIYLTDTVLEYPPALRKEYYATLALRGIAAFGLTQEKQPAVISTKNIDGVRTAKIKADEIHGLVANLLLQFFRYEPLRILDLRALEHSQPVDIKSIRKAIDAINGYIDAFSYADGQHGTIKLNRGGKLAALERFAGERTRQSGSKPTMTGIDVTGVSGGFGNPEENKTNIEETDTITCTAITPSAVFELSIHGPEDRLERDCFLFTITAVKGPGSKPRKARIWILEWTAWKLKEKSPMNLLWPMAARAFMLGIGEKEQGNHYIGDNNYLDLLDEVSEESFDGARLEIARLSLRFFTRREGLINKLCLYVSTKFSIPTITEAVKSLNREADLFESDSHLEFRLKAPGTLPSLRKLISEMEQQGEKTRSPNEKTQDDPAMVSQQEYIPTALYANTRGYLQKVVTQINGCYSYGWYDACAVMVRRLIETLIIEVFEKKGLSEDIKEESGDFKKLAGMIACLLEKRDWNLDHPTRQGLPKFKDLGNFSAHSRKYNAGRQDLDKVAQALRVVSEDLLYVAGLKN